MTALPLTREGYLDGGQLLALLRPEKRYVRPEPTDAMRDAAERFGLGVITQPRAKGCLVAAVAMLTGRDYSVVYNAVTTAQAELQTSGWQAALDYLVVAGFDIQTFGEPDAGRRTPPHPSLLKVSIDGGAQGHAVVLLPCGTVIDPLLTVPTTRALYQVHELYALTQRAGYTVTI